MTEDTAAPSGLMRVQGTSRLAFGATTAALVTLASGGTAVLVSQATREVATPTALPQGALPAETPAGGDELVVTPAPVDPTADALHAALARRPEPGRRTLTAPLVALPGGPAGATGGGGAAPVAPVPTVGPIARPVTHPAVPPVTPVTQPVAQPVTQPVTQPAEGTPVPPGGDAATPLPPSSPVAPARPAEPARADGHHGHGKAVGTDRGGRAGKDDGGRGSKHGKPRGAGRGRHGR